MRPLNGRITPSPQYPPSQKLRITPYSFILCTKDNKLTKHEAVSTLFTSVRSILLQNFPTKDRNTLTKEVTLLWARADGREGLPAKSGYGETAQGSFGTFSSLVHSQLAYPTTMLKSLSCGLAFEWPRLLAGVDESPPSRLAYFDALSTRSSVARRPAQA